MITPFIDYKIATLYQLLLIYPDKKKLYLKHHVRCYLLSMYQIPAELFVHALCRQISLDCMFLESQQIIDYSLLLGLHFRAPEHLKALLETPGSLHKPEHTFAKHGTSHIEKSITCVLLVISYKNTSM